MKRTSSRNLGKPAPQRTCVACRQVKTKREMVRLLRATDGGVEIDSGGKGAGRGAYLCRARECWESALKSGRLEHSLRTTLKQDQREQLMRIAEEKLFSRSG